jgi:hypothetical protein
LKWICVPSMIAATKLRRMCLPSMMIAWTWSGSVFPQWSQLLSSDECVALDDDCLNLKWICVPWMIATTQLRPMWVPSMKIATMNLE